MSPLDDFTKAYLTCALWADSPDEGQSGEAPLTLEDFAPAAIERAKTDCERFQAENAEQLTAAYALHVWHPDAPTPQHSAGHDFWLTRNHHGAGFWDRGLGLVGDALTRACGTGSTFPPCDLIIGDDGKVHIE